MRLPQNFRCVPCTYIMLLPITKGLSNFYVGDYLADGVIFRLKSRDLFHRHDQSKVAALEGDFLAMLGRLTDLSPTAMSSATPTVMMSASTASHMAAAMTTTALDEDDRIIASKSRLG